jgi:hypothetical protein
MLWRRVRFAGALATGKCTSILFSRLPDACCKLPCGVGVAEMLVRGVVLPLPRDGLAEVKRVDESDVTLEALRRPGVGRFAGSIASSCGDAADDTDDEELATSAVG